MVGLVLSRDYRTAAFRDMPRRTLQKKGVEALALLDILPDIPLDTIRKRGKANSFAKGLVCLQVIWMLIQTIARKIFDLPITLLELNTVVHIRCAIAMYAIW